MPEQFVQAYLLLKRSIRYRAAAIGLNAADREDLEQQVAVRVWLAVGRFDPARGSLVTFVESVARNEVASFLRSRRYQHLEESLEAHERVLTAPDRRHDACIDIRRVLSTVVSADRAVAALLTESTVTETGCELSISRAATYRAIQRLRAAFISAGLCSASWRHRCRGGQGWRVPAHIDLAL